MTDDDFDAYSLPVSPSWADESAGQRLSVRNDDTRATDLITRAERSLEITCGNSVVGVVHPRGRPHDWRLQLLDQDEHLLRRDDHEADARLRMLATYGGQPAPDEARRAPFTCVCGRMHVLDRDAVLELAELYEPRNRRGASARRVDFRRVARPIRAGGL